MKNIFITCFFACLFTPIVYSNDWTLNIFEPPDGSHIEEVRDIEVLPDGSIWFATWGSGLAKLQGYNWTLYDKLKGLPSNYLTSLLIDESDTIWVATENGICLFSEPNVIQVYNQINLPFLLSNSFTTITQLTTGEILFGSNDGSLLVCCNSIVNQSLIPTGSIHQYDGKQWFYIKVGSDEQSDIIHTVVETNDSKLFLAQDQFGISVFNHPQWEKLTLPEHTGRVRSIIQDLNNTLWGSGHRVFQFNEEDWSFPYEYQSNVLALHPNGSIFSVNDNGVDFFDQQEWQHIPYPSHFGEPRARICKFANDQIGWIGTKEGIIEIKKTVFQKQDTTLQSSKAFHAANNSYAIQVDQNGHVSYYRDQKWQNIYSIDIDHTADISVISTSNDILFLKHGNTIDIFNIVDQSLIDQISIPSDIYTNKLYIHNNSDIYIYNDTEIFHYQSGHWVKSLDSQIDDLIVSVCSTSDDSILVCKSKIVEIWKNNSLIKPFPIQNYIEDGVLQQHPLTFAKAMHDGSIWMGTRGYGLITHQNDKLRSITTKDDLISNRIVSMIEASDGTIWIASEHKGISTYKDNHLIHFQHSDGITSSEVINLYQDKNNHIWFTNSNRELFIYKPHTSIPDTKISNYPKTIPYNEKGFISVTGYDMWNITPIRELKYSWRILNNTTNEVVKNWRDYSSDNSFELPILKAGTYRFELKSINKFRIEDPDPATVTYTVLPQPITTQKWFVPLIAFIFITFCILLIYNAITRKALQNYTQNLHDLVDEKTKILSGQNLKLQDEINHRKQVELQLYQSQKLESVGRLAGGIAHDINNVLTAIHGYAELLIKTPYDKHIFDKSTETIVLSCKKASDIIKQLLAFSRKQKLNPQYVDINASLHSIKNILEKLIQENIELHYNLESDLKTILIDPTQLEQVILNLVANAKDAMPNGGQITISTMNCNSLDSSIHQNSHQKSNKQVQLKIQDTGTGIKQDIHDKIYEPFFTTKQVNEGSGLGLSTVHGIVKQSQGHIHFESTPNHGTTFYLVFSAQNESATQQNDTIIEHKNSLSLNILVVEDNEEILNLIRFILNKKGHSIVTATNGVEALEILSDENQTFDLLITDIIMPKMGGIELYQQIESTMQIPNTIFITGYTEQFDTIPANTTLLQKPFKPMELLNLIHSLYQ